MRKQINPMVAVIAVIVAIVGVGLLVYKVSAGGSNEVQVIVKPANPDDPKYKPDPKLGLSGGAGTNTEAKGNTND